MHWRCSVAMAEYRLSQRAKAQLVEIDAYTERVFGRYQADAYNAGFEKTFELIAEFPRIGRSADELKIGYRRYRHQSHYIFYTEEEGCVLIRTIIHTAQDLRPDLID